MKNAVMPDRLPPPTATSTDWRWWALVLTYYVACCLMHLRFSIWLVRQRDTVLGHMAYADLVPGLAVVAGMGLILWIAYRLRNSPRPWLTSAYLAALAGCGWPDRPLPDLLHQ